MPIRPAKNTKQVNMDLPLPLLERAQRFATNRGETFKDVVCQALERHMDSPPPPPEKPKLPPLPPVREKPGKAKK